MLNDLSEFIQSNPDPNWNERSQFKCFSTATNIRDSGEPRYSSGFISKWTQMYELLGVAGLKLGYLGRSVIRRNSDRLSSAPDQNYWNLAELQGYVQQKYDVCLTLSKATTACLKKLVSWKKHKNVIPKRPRTGQKKKRDYRLVRSPSCPDCLWAVGGLLRDECHLLWGISAAMFGVKLMSASKFPSSMNAASKPTMEPLISALSNVWFKPIKQGILSPPLPS